MGPQSRPHSPVYDCIWHIQAHRAGPTGLYMVHMAIYGVYGIYRPPKLVLLPCIWCIWHIQTPKAGPTALYMVYMAYTDPQSWPHCPAYGVYGCIWCIWHIQAPSKLVLLPCIWCIWHIQAPKAGPTALYMVYMAYTDPKSWPHCPVYGVYGCIWCIWHIQTPKAGPTALYMVYMAYTAAFALGLWKMRRKTQTCRKNAYLPPQNAYYPQNRKTADFSFHELNVLVHSCVNQRWMLLFLTKTSQIAWLPPTTISAEWWRK